MSLQISNVMSKAIVFMCPKASTNYQIKKIDITWSIKKRKSLCFIVTAIITLSIALNGTFTAVCIIPFEINV